MYHFSIPGGGFVTLQQLVEVLGIAHSEAYSENASNNEVNRGDLYTGADDDSEGREQSVNNIDTYLDVEISDKTRDFVANVESVEFSSPDLVWVKKIVEASTVGVLKEANGLECQHSDELTEEQIAEINAQTVESGEWALISILPFESEESLIVTMKTGEVFTVRITDAYNTPVKLHFVKEDGTPLTSITYDDETINAGNDGIFTLTADWLNQHLGTNGGELDLTQVLSLN